MNFNQLDNFSITNVGLPMLMWSFIRVRASIESAWTDFLNMARNWQAKRISTARYLFQFNFWSNRFGELQKNGKVSQKLQTDKTKLLLQRTRKRKTESRKLNAPPTTTINVSWIHRWNPKRIQWLNLLPICHENFWHFHCHVETEYVVDQHNSHNNELRRSKASRDDTTTGNKHRNSLFIARQLNTQNITRVKSVSARFRNARLCFMLRQLFVLSDSNFFLNKSNKYFHVTFQRK